MKTRDVVALILLFLSLPTSAAAGAKPVRIDASLTQIPIGRQHYEYLEDKDKRLTIRDIASSTERTTLKWQAAEKAALNKGYTNAAYWIRLSVENTSDQAVNWYLQESHPLLSYVFLFVPEGPHDFKEIKTGADFRFEQRPIAHRSFVFPLRLGPKTTETYYLRVESEGTLSWWGPPSSSFI